MLIFVTLRSKYRLSSTPKEFMLISKIYVLWVPLSRICLKESTHSTWLLHIYLPWFTAHPNLHTSILVKNEGRPKITNPYQHTMVEYDQMKFSFQHSAGGDTHTFSIGSHFQRSFYRVYQKLSTAVMTSSLRYSVQNRVFHFFMLGCRNDSQIGLNNTNREGNQPVSSVSQAQ